MENYSLSEIFFKEMQIISNLNIKEAIDDRVLCLFFYKKIILSNIFCIFIENKRL